MILTNDDGVAAPGLLALAHALHNEGYQPSVVAPDRERSLCGHSMTMGQPLTLERFRGAYPKSLSVWACDGTPSDCVVLALEALELPSEILISGINNGSNLGTDVTYSGTVSAAMEALIAGVPAMAVSLNAHSTNATPHFETAALVVLQLLKQIECAGIPKGVLLNVNVPDLPRGDIKGIKVTRQGARCYVDKLRRLTDSEGRQTYWLTGTPQDCMEDGTDVWAAAEGYVSVTPIHLDLTHMESLNAISHLANQWDL